MACGILVPQAGIKPALDVFEVQSLNHWTTRESRRNHCIFDIPDK